MTEPKCPIDHKSYTAGTTPMMSEGTSNNDWWPSSFSVDPLLHNSPKSDPYGPDFDYVKEFNSLDLSEVKESIKEVMKTSQPWWPADFGHYGPLFIRMAWHSAGTYRVQDGRGGGGQGLQRFAPLNSWPDNVNLDKARRLLWPVKKRYGRKLSWADLMILAGNVALEDMGFPTFGFAGGRADVWEPDNTYWGSETEWLANKRYDESREANTLEDPLAAVQMGLIYVNPEGPDGNPDFKLAAADIRTTFARMAMNDEETVALIAGGHAFGKTHGAGNASQVSSEPEGAELHDMGLGWKNSQGKGHSVDTISSGLEVTWTPNPIQWDNDYLRLIYAYDNWELEDSPAGAKQWRPVADEVDLAPHAHLEGELVEIRMLTTDLALRFGDEEYDRISRKFLNDFDYFTDVFARAWFKLTHRDMGPRSRYHGPEVPEEILIWQDPLPTVPSETLSDKQAEEIKRLIDLSDITVIEALETAWAAASVFRNTDKRGGLNGARIALSPQKDWEINSPESLSETLKKLETVRSSVTFDVSLSDTIALASSWAIEKSALSAGATLTVTFIGGRVDATQDMTDVDSFNHLKPLSDAFRNSYSAGHEYHAEAILLDRATLLGLTPPEMTALYGGMRAIGVGHERVPLLTGSEDPKLSNEFFTTILDTTINWTPGDEGVYLGNGRVASRADLVFGSNSVLRAYSEVYASDDGLEKLMKDFVKVWHKIMMLDRFEVLN